MITRRELLQSAVALGLAPMTGSLQAAEPQSAFKSSFSNVRESLGPTRVKFSHFLVFENPIWCSGFFRQLDLL